MMTRRGFTLVELLVAMVLLTMVGAVTYNVLLNAQRASRRQLEQTNLQDNVRAGTLILPSELQEGGYDDLSGADLIAIGANSIRFRAMRGVGFVCDIVSATELRIYKDATVWYRTPTANDSILYFIEQNQSLASDDEWLALGISAVDLDSECGADPAIALTIEGVGFPVYMASVFVGGPVRFFEAMELGLYAADGRSWLGARSLNAGEVAYQPVLGPLADGNGLEFTYYNSSNAVTADPNSVRTIQIRLRGRSDEPVTVGTGQAIVDLDVTTRVALRNALRP